MASKHAIEYARSGRAKCHGPCGGQLIGKGELRYGMLVVDNRYGESHHWYHWRCVPKKALQRLKSARLEMVQGWIGINEVDRQHIRSDVARGRASYSAAPAPAPAAAPPTPGPSTQKRKRESEIPIIEIPDDDDVEDAAPVEAEPVEELYVSFRTEIVGVQYYTGMVGNMERVLIRREPTNQYDRNAIKVFNAAGVGVGHLSRNTAAKLAPLMDAQRVTVEGIVTQGNVTRGGTVYTLPAEVKIYGRSDQRATLEPALRWATPGQRGFDDTMRTAEYTGNPARAPALPPPVVPASQSYAAASSSQAQASSAAAAKALAEQQRRYAEAQKALELRTMLESLSKVDDDGRRTGLMDALCGVDGEDGVDVLKLPELEEDQMPFGLQAGVELMKHQKQALKWCLAKEHPRLPAKESDPAVQFCSYKIVNGKPIYYNSLTHMPSRIENPPVLGRGGLIADAMGLGKTLTILALALMTKREPKNGYSGSTLIVCPLSVLSNWEKQIADHVQHGKLKTLVYYNTGRNASVEEMEKADIVITTYQVVAQDYAKSVAASAGVEAGPSKKKRKTDGGLMGVKWRRVVLDEGHQIRNPKTQAAIACRALTAERRWVVTGTPIINSPKDLGSILQFLQVCAPLDQEDYFKSLLERPLKASTAEGARLLKSVMHQICLRRTKEMQDDAGNHLVKLPPVEMVQVPVTLPPETRALYDEIESLSRQRFEYWMQAARAVHGQNAIAGANVLGMLTRMRQLVLHPGLIPRNYVETLREPAAAVAGEERVQQVVISPKDKARLQRQLAQAIEENEECPVCFEVLREPRITVCSHSFCFACITEVIRRDTRCPMDRRTLGMQDLIEPPEPTEATQRWNGEDDDDMDEDANAAEDQIRAGSSAKIDQLVKMLQLTPATEKSLVFSQFTGFLDKIEEALDAAGIGYVRLDGKMSAKRREEVIRRFSVPLRDKGKGKGKAKAVPDAGARARLATALRSSSPPRAPSPPPVPSPSKSASSSKRPARAAKAAKGAMVIPSSDDDLDFDARVDAADDDDYVEDANGAAKDEPMSDDGGFFSDESEEDFKPRRFVGKGKGKARAGASLADYDRPAGNPPVMLISLKAGALGLNLTVANNVYLMDPWWQEGIESQAIDRCNRIGQTKTVHVYQMVAENTVEQKVLDIQERKKNLIKQAFSGIKSRETERQKREARMNDLIELFGMRNREEED